MVSPAVVDSFNRVEAHRHVDVPSYVVTLGNNKYALIKTNRRQALLERARARQRSTVLDDATRRKTTNIASAEASRAKKQFIVNELFRQLRDKTADSLVLASEIRRLSLLLENKTIENHILMMELQKHRAMWTNVLSTPVTPSPQTAAAPPATSSFMPHTAAHFEHTTHQPQPFQPHVDTAMLQPDSHNLHPLHPPPVPAANPLATAHHEAVHIDISEMEQLLKSHPIPSPSSTLDYADASHYSKPFIDPQLAPPPLHPTSTDSSQLASFNPSDQFTVAG